MKSTIIIKNVETVVAESEVISTNTVSLESARESIDQILKEVSEYWSQNGESAQSFYEGLKKNAETLKTIGECNKEFAIAIENYAEKQQTQSKKVIQV